jgi:hypothetical protein
MTKPITLKRQREILKSSGKVTERSKKDYWGQDIFKPFKVVLSKPLKGFKKVYQYRPDHSTKAQLVAELEIPVGATVVCGTHNGYKLRTDRARVLSIKTLRGNRSIKKATAGYNSDFEYQVGKTATPANAFNKTFSQCGGGLHFFLSRRQAERY